LNVHLEKKAMQDRERADRLAGFDQATEAWKKSVAQEGLPRCSFCISAGFPERAIGHSVSDSNGIITCPILIERNLARSKRKSLAIYSSSGADEALNTATNDDDDNQTRKGASLDRVDYFQDDLPSDSVPDVYDPYRKGSE
jgi:hypothetical protein